ncbi:hypothetical protein sos41_01060 [Alphaproteobacteria bacterium SO-S41]|nr:hypothetical protein sos41_01060 [Alphaproteobacteria bacterium SO-S41]
MSIAATGTITFIQTRDLDTALAFYRDTLGLAHSHFDGFAHVFAMGDATLRLTQLPDWTAGAHPALGWRVADIAASVAALKAKGVTLLVYPGMGQDEAGIWTAPGGVAKVCWFNDPDKNLLSLTQY